MRHLFIILAVLAFTTAAQGQLIPRVKMAEVVNTYSRKTDSVYVINFWATFCRPCVGEIPHFISITNRYAAQKVKLLLVSLDLKEDYPAKIRAFAKQRHFNANMAWLNETNADVFCPMIDKSWSGAIPATIMVNARTGYRKFFEAELSAEEFEKALKEVISN